MIFSRLSRCAQADQLDLGARQIPVCRHERQILHARRHHRQSGGLGLLGCQRLVDRFRLGCLILHADAAGEIALRVDIDQKDALFSQREGRGQVDGRGGFTHAPLLIGDSDDLAHFQGDASRRLVDRGVRQR